MSESLSYTEAWLKGPLSTQFYTRTYLPPADVPVKYVLVFVHGFSDYCAACHHPTCASLPPLTRLSSSAIPNHTSIMHLKEFWYSHTTNEASATPRSTRRARNLQPPRTASPAAGASKWRILAGLWSMPNMSMPKTNILCS